MLNPPEGKVGWNPPRGWTVLNPPEGKGLHGQMDNWRVKKVSGGEK